MELILIFTHVFLVALEEKPHLFFNLWNISKEAPFYLLIASIWLELSTLDRCLTNSAVAASIEYEALAATGLTKGSGTTLAHLKW